MGIVLSKTGDMWRSRGMERERETRKIRRKGVVVWVTAHLDLEEWELWGGVLEAHKALLTQPYQQERGISVFAWTHTQPAVQRHRLCLLLFTGHSLLSKAMLDLSSALRLTTVIQQRYSGGGKDQMICCVRRVRRPNWAELLSKTSVAQQKEKSSRQCQVETWDIKTTQPTAWQQAPWEREFHCIWFSC